MRFAVLLLAAVAASADAQTYPTTPNGKTLSYALLELLIEA